MFSIGTIGLRGAMSAIALLGCEAAMRAIAPGIQPHAFPWQGRRGPRRGFVPQAPTAQNALVVEHPPHSYCQRLELVEGTSPQGTSSRHWPWRTVTSTWPKQEFRDRTRQHLTRFVRFPKHGMLEWQNHLTFWFGIHARAPPEFPASRAKFPHGVSCVSPLLPAPFLPRAPRL